MKQTAVQTKLLTCNINWKSIKSDYTISSSYTLRLTRICRTHARVTSENSDLNAGQMNSFESVLDEDIPCYNQNASARGTDQEIDLDIKYKLKCLPKLLSNTSIQNIPAVPAVPAFFSPLNPSKFTDYHRAAIIDWLMCMQWHVTNEPYQYDSYVMFPQYTRFNTQGIHFAAFLIDRFMAIRDVEQQDLQLLVAACICIAMKMEVSDDSNATASEIGERIGAIDKKDIGQMEITVLTTLNFNVEYLGLFPLGPEEMMKLIPQSAAVRRFTHYLFDKGLTVSSLKCTKKHVLFIASLCIAKRLYKQRRIPIVTNHKHHIYLNKIHKLDTFVYPSKSGCTDARSNEQFKSTAIKTIKANTRVIPSPTIVTALSPSHQSHAEDDMMCYESMSPDALYTSISSQPALNKSIAKHDHKRHTPMISSTEPHPQAYKRQCHH